MSDIRHRGFDQLEALRAGVCAVRAATGIQRHRPSPARATVDRD
jgi:hypothetical protein